jgi:hypothetical protein
MKIQPVLLTQDQADILLKAAVALSGNSVGLCLSLSSPEEALLLATTVSILGSAFYPEKDTPEFRAMFEDFKNKIENQA